MLASGRGGRLDTAERRRAQRWLTYEQNEVILASALRIVNEMEGFADVSKSVVSRPLSRPSQEREVRTETAVLDRHGIAARFLRLAFRINMEQLKLVEQDAAPLPEKLTAEELAEEERLDALVAADLAEARRRSDERAAACYGEPVAEQETIAAEQEENAAAEEPVAADSDEAFIHAVNNLNNGPSEKTAVKHDPPCTCAADAAEEKNSQALFSERQPPDPWVDPLLNPTGTWHEMGEVESHAAALIRLSQIGFFAASRCA